MFSLSPINRPWDFSSGQLNLRVQIYFSKKEVVLGEVRSEEPRKPCNRFYPYLKPQQASLTVWRQQHALLLQTNNRVSKSIFPVCRDTAELRKMPIFRLKLEDRYEQHAINDY